MTIRSATSHDVPAVLPMVVKIARYHEALDPAKYAFDGDPAESYRNWLASRIKDKRSVFLVADAAVEGAAPNLCAFLVGGVQGEIPIYRVKAYGLIYDLWVEERYRNEGIARQMVTLAIERFREMGVRQVRLDSAFANVAAQNLFKSCGLRPSIIEMLIEL